MTKMVTLRKATAGDEAAIKAIVRAARINPTGIHWQNFIVAADDASGEVVGIGQIKPHSDGTWELASIATVPGYQRRGIASRVVRHLVESHAGDLYLTCMDYLEPFYARFGFRAIGEAEMPRAFRRMVKLAGLILPLAGRRLLVMKRDNEGS